MDEKEYIVTVKEGVDWREVHEDLTKENQKQFIPNHKVPVDDLREINKRNTHYHLSDHEANELRKDSRIEAVEIPMMPQKKALQEGNFNRAGSDSGQQDNWGLLRHIADNNIFVSISGILAIFRQNCAIFSTFAVRNKVGPSVNEWASLVVTIILDTGGDFLFFNWNAS